MLVVDVPLLVENHLEGAYDVVVVVDAPDDIRMDRLLSQRGMTEDAVLARMGSQASRADRLEVADFVIDNSGDIDLLRSAVDALWGELLQASP